MTTKYNLTITKREEFYNPVCRATIPACYIGKTPILAISGNTELTGTLIEFRGNTEQEVISQVIESLKGMNLHGTLHIIRQYK